MNELEEVTKHSLITFQLILKLWKLTKKQKEDIQSNIKYLKQTLISAGE